MPITFNAPVPFNSNYTFNDATAVSYNHSHALSEANRVGTFTILKRNPVLEVVNRYGVLGE